MKNRRLVLTGTAAALVGAAVLLAQGVIQPAGNGGVAAQAIGRLLVNPDGSAELFGYLPVVAGIPSTLLFSGEPSEKTAHFTVRSTRFRLETFRNGALGHFTVAPLEGESIRIRVYFDASPNQDFERPETFGDGSQAGTYVWHSGLGSSTEAIATFSGGLELASSSALTHAGRLLDLGGLAPSTTILIQGPALRARPEQSVSIPWGGTVLASPAR